MATMTSLRDGTVKGQPKYYIYGHNSRQVPKTAEGFWSLVRRGEGCWEWQGKRDPKDGYGVFRWGGPYKRTHRIAYELAVGPIPPGMLVCHHCDNPPCCRPDHLFVGTISDNSLDMVRKGRMHANDHPRVKGERHPNAKLTDEKVLEIRSAYDGQVATMQRLAEHYGVTYQNVKHVVTGKSWRHLLPS